MARASYFEVANRWADVVTGRTTKNYLNNERMPIYGDRIHSYGSHFEIARPLRDKQGETVGFLLNGNTYSNTTTKHQGEVRSAVQRTRLPSVTIPHRALDAADILLDTVQIIEVKPDWWQEREELRFEMPGRWEYDPLTYDDDGGWVNSRTGQFVPRRSWSDSRPAQETCDACRQRADWKFNPDVEYEGTQWEQITARNEARAAHLRLRHGVWEEVSRHGRQTGRKKVVSNSYIVWDLVDVDGQVAYSRTVSRHFLGGSLIRAQVRYMGRRRCTNCPDHSGVVKPWTYRVNDQAEGPLTKREDGWSWQPIYDEPGWVDDGRALRPRTTSAWDWTTDCPTCQGTGWERAQKARWAYFLSGFDENETRPSYFFCELPAAAKPTTYDEALEALKPSAVRLAEQMQREVKRQGDIFAIPMPGLTLAELKKRGGRHIRKPHLVLEGSMLKYATAPDADLRRYVQHLREHGKEVRVTWSGPRPQLLNTNHEATEVVQIGREVYARGTMRHVPQNRRPDHKMLSLGKGWHLIVKNTVPVAA